MKIIATLMGEDVDVYSDGSIVFTCQAHVDNDGSSNPEHDPDWQPNTSYHLNGKPLDAETVPFVVLPPIVIASVPGVVLGCLVVVLCRGLWCAMAAGDVGPSKKLGEISVEGARRLKMNPSPINGGVDDHIVHYIVFPGIPAVIDGVTFPLQPSRT